MASVGEMKFIFVCPNTQAVFYSADFSFIENRGVTTDAGGSRFLDAKIELDNPCPFCGAKHVYRAAELTCPFDGTK